MFRYAAFVLLSLILVPWRLLAEDSPLVIVFPLDAPEAGTLPRWLGEGIAISISDQLEGEGLRSMDRSERIRLVENLDLPPGAQLSRGSMIRVAQNAGANLVVLGSYAGTEKNLRIAIRLLDIQTLKLSGEMSANGPLSALPQMENELAWLALRSHGLEKAVTREQYQIRARKIPNRAYAYYIQSLSAPGETEQLHLLLRALEAFRNFPRAQFLLGRIYFHRGDCKSAIPHLMQGQSDASAQPEIEFMRGTCLLQGDQLSSAVQTFLQALQTSRPIEVLNNIGVAYLRKGDLELALSALLEASGMIRTDPTVAFNLALVRHLQKNDAAAQSLLEEACRSNPQNGFLQFLLAIVLKDMGENDRSALAAGKAEGLGVHVAKLHAEDPKTWARTFLFMENR